LFLIADDLLGISLNCSENRKTPFSAPRAEGHRNTHRPCQPVQEVLPANGRRRGRPGCRPIRTAADCFIAERQLIYLPL